MTLAPSLAPRDESEAVANGAQLLDEKHPGWWRLIDIEALSIASIRHCVCAQLAAELTGADPENLSWSKFARQLTNSPDALWKYGFAGGTYVWHVLDDEWKLAIQARLDADRQLVVHEAQESLILA